MGLFGTPWTLAHQAPLSMGFTRQEYWSGLPFPSPGDLPDPGMEPGSPALQADSIVWATRPKVIAISFSRGPSWPRDGTWVSCTASRLSTVWATRSKVTAIVCMLSHLSLCLCKYIIQIFMMGNSLAVPQKVKHRIITWPKNSTFLAVHLKDLKIGTQIIAYECAQQYNSEPPKAETKRPPTSGTTNCSLTIRWCFIQSQKEASTDVCHREDPENQSPVEGPTHTTWICVSLLTHRVQSK